MNVQLEKCCSVNPKVSHTNLVLECGFSSNMKMCSYISGKAAQLFTSVLYNNYSPPPGFCFDVLCDDEPFIDDKHSPDYNVDKLVCLTFII
jgi:hypothetical protein